MPVYFGVCVPKKQSPRDVAHDALADFQRRRGVPPASVRMRLSLAAEVGELDIPVVIDPKVPVNFLYFEIPQGKGVGT